MAAGKPVKVEKIDDATVRFTFAAPYGDFLAELASPLGQHPVLYQKKYCAPFHPEVQRRTSSGGRRRTTPATGRPLHRQVRRHRGRLALGQSRPADARSLDHQGALCRRCGPCRHGAQPLFLAGRPRGHQLPYIDELFSPIAQDVESLILDAVGGKIDFQVRHLDAAANRPVLAENREKGGYEFFEASRPAAST